MISIIISIISILLFGFSVTIFCLDYIKSISKILIIPFSWFTGCVILTFLYYLILLLGKFNIEVNLSYVLVLLVPVLAIILTKYKSIQNFFTDSQAKKQSEYRVNKHSKIISILEYLSGKSLWIFIALIFCINLVKPGWAWDSWMIWNLKAKIIYYDIFNTRFLTNNSYAYSHLDYPLLVSVVQAYIAKVQGFFDERFTQVFFSISFLSFVLTLYVYARASLDKFLSALFVLTCICAPSLLLNFTGGYADCILASYLMLILVIISSSYFNNTNNQKMYLKEKVLLTTISFSGMIMTKNEGTSIVMVVILLLFFLSIPIKKIKLKNMDFKIWMNTILSPFIIALLLSSPWYFLKYSLHLSNDVVNITSLNAINPSVIYGKLPFIIDFIVNISLLNINFWGILYFIVPIFVLIGLLERKYKLTFFFISGFLVNLLILVLIYILSPHDLKSHLASSSDRYILAISPFLLCYIPGLFSKNDLY